MTGLTGTGVLLRLALRRDRIQLPTWLLVVIGTFAASVASVVNLYDTEAKRRSYAMTGASSAVFRAFNGPIAHANTGSIVVTETFATVSVLVALMSIFAVVRHTRQNEETGRAEMIGSGVVGRYAPLVAAVATGVLANACLAVLVPLVLLAYGLPLTGSLALGLGFAGVGIAFTAVAALTAQLAESARAANGLAAAILGFAFLTRAIGDAAGTPADDQLSVTSAWPSWISPLAWGQQVRSFGGERWWVLAPFCALFLALTAAAFRLAAHRDLGTGLLPVRPGPATAAPTLLSPLGLAWRLQRGVWIGWAVGIAITGLVFGGVANEVDKMTRDNEAMLDMLRQLGGGAGDLIDVYLAGMLGVTALMIGGYTVQALLRLRGEEASGHLEPVLATAVARSRWLASHVLLATVGSAALLLLLGATTGLASGVVLGQDLGGIARQVWRISGAALAWLPALLALGGFVIAVFGLLPKLTTALSWAGLLVCVLMGQIGALLKLPQPVLDVSPFTHVPEVPVAALNTVPLALLMAVAVALAGAGLALFRRRDLAN